MSFRSTQIRGVVFTVLGIALLPLFVAANSYADGSYALGIASDVRTEMYEDDAEYLLRQLPDEWEGVPYKYGGVTRRGIDCSAFVQQAYEDVFDVAIPRTTRLQLEAGFPVAKEEVRVGDLVLFRSSASSSSRHVGIYVGNDEFVHISSSRRSGGVKIENLDQFLENSGISLLAIRRVASVIPGSDNYASTRTRARTEQDSGQGVQGNRETNRLVGEVRLRNVSRDRMSRQTFDDMDRTISERSRANSGSFNSRNEELTPPESIPSAPDSVQQVVTRGNSVIISSNSTAQTSKAHHLNSSVRRSLYAGFYAF